LVFIWISPSKYVVSDLLEKMLLGDSKDRREEDMKPALFIRRMAKGWTLRFRSATTGKTLLFIIAAAVLISTAFLGCNGKSGRDGKKGGTTSPPPTPSLLERHLADANIILSEVDPQQVRGWLKDDPAYKALAGACLQIIGNGRIVDPIPLDVINGKYKLELGVKENDYLTQDKYNQPASLKMAIFHTWYERHPNAPQKAFADILAQKPAITIALTSHKDNDQAHHGELIRGTVSDSKANVWVIVHPLKADGYWVQNPSSVRPDGKWSCFAYFGVSSDTQIGESFEVQAVANPKTDLKAGDVLDTWPEAEASSNVVEVVRIKG
jgi:hypothetical protein